MTPVLFKIFLLFFCHQQTVFLSLLFKHTCTNISHKRTWQMTFMNHIPGLRVQCHAWKNLRIWGENIWQHSLGLYDSNLLTLFLKIKPMRHLKLEMRNTRILNIFSITYTHTWYMSFRLVKRSFINCTWLYFFCDRGLSRN